MNQMENRLYSETQWRRCWISNYRDGGWIVGELDYSNGLYYIINSDSNGEIVVAERFVVDWD